MPPKVLKNSMPLSKEAAISGVVTTEHDLLEGVVEEDHEHREGGREEQGGEACLLPLGGVADAGALGIGEPTLRSHQRDSVLETAVLQLSGCEWVDLTVGKQDYVLGQPGGARSIAAQVLKVAGVPWTLPSF